MPLPKKPIYNRYLCLVFGFVLGLPAALCQPPTQDLPAGALTEAEAVRLGLLRPEINALFKGEIGMAQSEVMATRRWPNPEFSYTHEEASSIPGDPDQDYFWLSQRFDLSGRRGLKTAAAERRVHAVTHDTELRRIELEAEIRQRFYEVLQRERRVEVVKRWAGRMQDIAAIIRRQEAAGEVSAYDLRRLIREQSSAEARLEAEQASLAYARERLKALLDIQEPRAIEPRVAGTLLPPAPPAPLESQLAALATRPDLLGLEQRVTAAELEQRAAARWWLPEIALGAGVKQITQGPLDDTVPLVSASIALPLLDRQQAEKSRAMAQAQLARSQQSLTALRAAGDVRGLWQQANQLFNAAHRFREETVQLSPELIRIAEAAYQGGQTGILELLDADRSMLEADLQALELELSARQAGIELDRLTGRSVARSPGDRNDQGSMQKAHKAMP